MRVEVGGLWDLARWELVEAQEVVTTDERGDVEPCPHAYDVHPREAPHTGRGWRVPRAVVAWNEAGCATTGVCLDCILAAVHQCRFVRWVPVSEGGDQCYRLRCLFKAKLEAVASGIAVSDEEFLAFIVTPDGRTVGEIILPQIHSGTPRLLLPAGAGPGEVE